MPSDDDGGGRQNALWRLERIEERQKDILHMLEGLIGQSNGIIQRGEERGWKIDAILADLQRGIKEIREVVEKRAVLTNPDIVKILVAGLIALAGGNFAVKAFVG
jgi:archaellum component FlaC